MDENEKLLTYLKRISADLHQTRRRLQDAEAKDQEPIAIVSMSCRFGGGIESPEDLWRLVEAGEDGLTEFPENREWIVDSLYDPDPDQRGASYVRQANFLNDPTGFDADFFGINPREALVMDPQHRMLLESTWEAIERAGIDPHTLRGSRTGVFAGTNGQDYTNLLASSASTASTAEGYVGTGTSASVLSGRVAYTLGLEGPAVTIDTACSASLVALHWATQALRQRECTLALVAGVSPTASAAEDIAEDVPKDVAEICRTLPTLLVDTSMTILIVACTLLLIGQYLERFVCFLEFFLGFLVSVIAIRVVLHGNATIGFLYISL